VEIYHLTASSGRAITDFLSQGVVLCPIAQTSQQSHIAACYLEAEGRIGAHDAASDQLLLVTFGGGTVSGREGIPQPIQPGDVVVWHKGESHETLAGPQGLHAIVVEADHVQLHTALTHSGPRPPT
jgi:quercetin dioxygenase-like cupin family protein